MNTLNGKTGLRLQAKITDMNTVLATDEIRHRVGMEHGEFVVLLAREKPQGFFRKLEPKRAAQLSIEEFLGMDADAIVELFGLEDKDGRSTK